MNEYITMLMGNKNQSASVFLYTTDIFDTDGHPLFYIIFFKIFVLGAIIVHIFSPTSPIVNNMYTYIWKPPRSKTSTMMSQWSSNIILIREQTITTSKTYLKRLVDFWELADEIYEKFDKLVQKFILRKL